MTVVTFARPGRWAPLAWVLAAACAPEPAPLTSEASSYAFGSCGSPYQGPYGTGDLTARRVSPGPP